MVEGLAGEQEMLAGKVGVIRWSAQYRRAHYVFA